LVFLYSDNFGKRLDFGDMGYTIWICDGGLATLYQVYEFVLEIPLIVVGFFEDIGDKIIDEILVIAPW
jgi:hypothetical protein